MRSFKETQNLMAVWMLLVIVVIIGFQIYPVRSNFNEVLNQPGVWVSVAVLIFLTILRLKTTYDEKGIHVVFIPFIWNKLITWDEIASAYMRTYTITDFGGWGYRISRQGTAYNAKGKHGIQLVLKNGKQILIGTQEPEEVQKIINQYKPYKDEF